MAAQNARLLGHSPAEEVKILALHGMLHLAGYDHERDHGEMARTEERLRKSLRLPAGLIDRSREPVMNGRKRKARSAVMTTQRKIASGGATQSASPNRGLAKTRAAGKASVRQVR